MYILKFDKSNMDFVSFKTEDEPKEEIEMYNFKNIFVRLYL